MPNVSLRNSAIKAKVSFVGSTGAILSSQSYNVSSVIRISVGSYRIIFSQPFFDDPNYSVINSTSEFNNTTPFDSESGCTVTTDGQATGFVNVSIRGTGENSGNAGFNSRLAGDTAIICIMILGGEDTSTPPTYSLRTQSIHARVSFPGFPAANTSFSTNISSVTRSSTGNYTVTYASALSSADHCVGINSYLSSSNITSGLVETDALFPTTTQARIYAKLVGNNISSETFYDPTIVEMVASSTETTASSVSLRENSSKSRARISSGSLVSSSNISSTTLLRTGFREFKLIDRYVDYTVLATSSQYTDNSAGIGSCTIAAKAGDIFVVSNFGFGENMNNRLEYNPTSLSVSTFGVFNEFDVSLNSTSDVDTCFIFTPGGACTNSSITVTATPLGGTAPYTYQWSLVGSIPDVISKVYGGFNITSPTSASTTFTCNDNPGTYTGYFNCLVTDSAGRKGRSGAFKFTSTHIDDSGLE